MAKQNKRRPGKTPPPSIRDRIKELRRVPAALLRANPQNWKNHPPKQREAVAQALAKIGSLALHRPRIARRRARAA